jgi:hypothetical protein
MKIFHTGAAWLLSFSGIVAAALAGPALAVPVVNTFTAVGQGQSFPNGVPAQCTSPCNTVTGGPSATSVNLDTGNVIGFYGNYSATAQGDDTGFYGATAGVEGNGYTNAKFTRAITLTNETAEWAKVQIPVVIFPGSVRVATEPGGYAEFDLTIGGFATGNSFNASVRVNANGTYSASTLPGGDPLLNGLSYSSSEYRDYFPGLTTVVSWTDTQINYVYVYLLPGESTNLLYTLEVKAFSPNTWTYDDYFTGQLRGTVCNSGDAELEAFFCPRARVRFFDPSNPTLVGFGTPVFSAADPNSVPLPASVWLAFIGLLALVYARRTSKR